MWTIDFILYVLFIFLGTILPLFLLRINGMRYLFLHNVLLLFIILYLIFLLDRYSNNHYFFSFAFLIQILALLLYYSKTLNAKKDYIVLGGLQALTLIVFLYNNLWMKQTLLNTAIVVFFYAVFSFSSLWFIWRLITNDSIPDRKAHLLIGSICLIFYTLLGIIESPAYSLDGYNVVRFDEWFNVLFEASRAAALIKIMVDKK